MLPPWTRGAASALEAQEQIVVFFASEIVSGMTPIVTDPDSVRRPAPRASDRIDFAAAGAADVIAALRPVVK